MYKDFYIFNYLSFQVLISFTATALYNIQSMNGQFYIYINTTDLRSSIQISSSFWQCIQLGSAFCFNTEELQIFIYSFSKEPSWPPRQRSVEPSPRARPLGHGDPLPKAKVCVSMWTKFWGGRVFLTCENLNSIIDCED